MEFEEYKDMFGLYFRVKEVRSTYKLLLNRRTKKVELHDSNFVGAQLIFDLPLTPWVLDKIKQTKIENSKLIFRKIDEENSKNRLNIIENSIYYAKNLLTQ